MTCNDEGHVIALELFDNELSGDLSDRDEAGLDDLKDLEYLGLASNDLTRAIPSNLGSLASTLKMLILHDNGLSGPIPQGLGDLANLTHLRLYNNHLRGSMPSQLDNRASLTDLVLGDC